MKRAGMMFFMVLWSGLVALFLMGAEESKTAKTSTTTTKSTKKASASPTKAKASAAKTTKKDIAKDTKLTTSTKTAVSVTSGTKTAYLTFDDGPSGLTPKVLDILKEKGVHATFFVIGGTAAATYKRIVEEGHAIGNHTYSHNSKIYKSPELFVADLKKQEELIFKFTGVRTDIMRFPNSSNNWNGGKNEAGQNRMVDICPAVEKAGYAYFDWNASGIDYDAKIGKTKEQILANIKETTGQSGKNFRIVLLHDSASHAPTVEALPAIIDFYQSKGYKFDILKHDSDTVHFPISKPKK